MKHAFDFLIDISDKMENKLAVTQKVLSSNIIPNLDSSDDFGMRTFLSVLGNPIIINSLDLGNNAKADFLQKAENLPIPNGGTPISAVIKESVNDFGKNKSDDKHIILVTAGEETDGGHYAIELDLHKPDVQVNIIGIGMTKQASEDATKATNATNGVFVNIPESDYNDNASISNILSPIIDILKGLATPKHTTKAANQQVNPTENKAKTNIEEKKVEEKKEESIQTEPQFEPMEIEIENSNSQVCDEPRTQPQQEETISETIEAPISKPTNLNQFTTQKVNVKVAKCEAKEIEDFDLLAQISQINAEISNLLKKNTDSVLKSKQLEDKLKSEIKDLRSAGKENANSIQQLDEALSTANSTIDKLKSIIADKEEEITALNNNKKDLMVNLRQWQERDRNVIIDVDAKERDAVSKASEKMLFTFLEKKYPNRVKWCNQNGKDTKGYDFEIVGYQDNETEYFIACKGAKDNRKTFFLTEKEWNKCLEQNLKYQVYLIRDVDSKPKILLIDNLMGWIQSGKVRPGASKNEKVKAGQVMLTLA